MSKTMVSKVKKVKAIFGYFCLDDNREGNILDTDKGILYLFKKIGKVSDEHFGDGGDSVALRDDGLVFFCRYEVNKIGWWKDGVRFSDQDKDLIDFLFKVFILKDESDFWKYGKGK